MKKMFLMFIAAASISAVNAQKGSIRLQPAVEIGIPMGDFGDFAKVGFGGSLKGLFGITPAGSITLQPGATFHSIKGSGGDASAYIVPILAGYQHSFDGFYVEPQVGIGIYGSSVKVNGVKVSASESAFTYAVGVGYLINNMVDIGARYQAGSKDGSTTSLVGIHIGYNFSLGGK